MTSPLDFDFKSLISTRPLNFYYNSQDWALWRDTYEGGTYFRRRYLEQFSDREEAADFARRTAFTPVPAYAKREVNRVKNALFQRFSDIIRRDGSKSMKSAREGKGRGVDGKGSTINAFIGTQALADLLVMGKVGVLVDAPRIQARSKAEVPADFSPYYAVYPLESIHRCIPAEHGSPSHYKAIMLEEVIRSTEVHKGDYTEQYRYRYYWIDERSGKVQFQLLDAGGQPLGEQLSLELEAIPFYLFDIGDSLLKDAAPHQVAMLNMVSSDTSYVIDANFPFLTRQRDNINAGSHLKGEDSNVKRGVQKGLFYGPKMERPGYIAPPTGPMELSLEMRRELKKEIREMISGQIEDLGDDGSMEAGLAAIGLCLEHGEQRLWDLWAAIEETSPSRRQIPTTKYPEQWSIKSDKERIEEADALAGTMYRVPGKKAKKEIAKLSVDILLRGKVKPEVMDEIKREIDEAPYCTSDPQIIIPAKEKYVVSSETAALALGFNPDEAAKAKADQAERAAIITAAQTDPAAARGNPDGSVDPDSSPEMEKEGGADKSDKLGGDNEPGVRGEGKAA